MCLIKYPNCPGRSRPDFALQKAMGDPAIMHMPQHPALQFPKKWAETNSPGASGPLIKQEHGLAGDQHPALHKSPHHNLPGAW